jgi:type III pantothenate kinase
MNLIIDQGNSRTKLAIFDDKTLVRHAVSDVFDHTVVANFIGIQAINGVILSTVKELSLEMKVFLKSLSSHFINLSHTTNFPFRVDYRTPETLGRDRLAGVAGAFYESEQRNILIIDAGTAITYDLLDASGIYKGGNIAPGLEMRLKALHLQTNKLPQVAKEGAIPPLGYDTETAIRSGVVQGIIFEIEGYIAQLQKEYPELLIFLTGGDIFYFDKMLKNITFADEFLVIKGLNRILLYNAK